MLQENIRRDKDDIEMRCNRFVLRTLWVLAVANRNDVLMTAVNCVLATVPWPNALVTRVLHSHGHSGNTRGAALASNYEIHRRTFLLPRRCPAAGPQDLPAWSWSWAATLWWQLRAGSAGCAVCSWCRTGSRGCIRWPSRPDESFRLRLNRTTVGLNTATIIGQHLCS